MNKHIHINKRVISAFLMLVTFIFTNHALAISVATPTDVPVDSTPIVTVHEEVESEETPLISSFNETITEVSEESIFFPVDSKIIKTITEDTPVIEEVEESVIVIDPTITILPFNTNPVQSLTVSATTDGTFLTSSSHTFTENGTFMFIAIGSTGNAVFKPVTVTNIDRTAPIITINPYNQLPTTGPVTVTAEVNEGTLNTTSHVFTENGSFTFSAFDQALNLSSVTVTITNITSPVSNPPTRNNSSSGSISDRCTNIDGFQGKVPQGYSSKNRVCTLFSNENTGELLNEGQVLGASKFIFTQEMYLGDNNDEVKELQERFIADGYMTGPSTGYFGLKTLAAVRKFQKDHGIRTINGIVYTTGNVGPLTLAALNK